MQQQRDTHSAGQSGGDTGILTLTICPLGSDHSIFQSFPRIPILDGDDAGVPPLIRSIKPIILTSSPISLTGKESNSQEMLAIREIWWKPSILGNYGLYSSHMHSHI